MKLLSALATLLLVLQVVAAVSFDSNQQHSGFVKVKRNVAGHPAPDHKAYRLRPSVKKRSATERIFKLEHDGLWEKYLAATSEDARAKILDDMKKLTDGKRGSTPSAPDQTHHLAPDYRHVHEGFAGPSAAAERAGEEEARHAAAFHTPLTPAQMEWAIAQHNDGLTAHKEEIEKLIRSNKELQDKLNAAKRNQKWQSLASVTALTVGGTVAATSILQTHNTDTRLENHADVINNLQTEVARLKAQNAQLPGAGSGSGLVGAPGVPATSGAAAGGPLV